MAKRKTNTQSWKFSKIDIQFWSLKNEKKINFVNKSNKKLEKLHCIFKNWECWNLSNPKIKKGKFEQLGKSKIEFWML